MTKVMNVAMIGGGFMGKAHAMAYASMPMFFWPAPAIPHRKVVVDVTDGAAEEARRRFGFDEASSDWRAVVARPDIDVVDICTPNNVHAEIAIAAAKAGKHIICEKPLARTVEEARAMAEAAKRPRASSTWSPSTTAARPPWRWPRNTSTKAASAAS
jgi:predicted dehydrogenase